MRRLLFFKIYIVPIVKKNAGMKLIKQSEHIYTGKLAIRESRISLVNKFFF